LKKRTHEFMVRTFASVIFATHSSDSLMGCVFKNT
jgi:hypothetical protein